LVQGQLGPKKNVAQARGRLTSDPKIRVIEERLNADLESRDVLVSRRAEMYLRIASMTAEDNRVLVEAYRTFTP
jgi:hypothetical protein